MYVGCRYGCACVRRIGLYQHRYSTVDQGLKSLMQLCSGMGV